jgi:CRISPR-associated protein Csb2
MPIIELHFPTRRLHATPWGRHVNEGAVEWPPSPWRVLRSLIATWYWKARDEVSENVARDLVHALSECPPSYQLPPVSLGHTRHYMPIIQGKNQKTTKVFDTFIHVGAPVRMKWDVSLPLEQSRALVLLCERLGYFGRAESLVEARVLSADAIFSANSSPLLKEQPIPQETELVRLLAPQANTEWRTAQTAATPAAQAKGKGRKSAKGVTAASLPSDLFAALHADTGDLRAAGWTIPPGSQLLDYVRPANCFDLPPIHRRHVEFSNPIVARFAVASAVLPRVTRTVSVAERMHQALVKYSKQAPVFTGRENGRPLAGHRHAHFFCEANGPRDAITHVTVFAPMGLDAEARRALEELARRGVWGHGGHDLQLVLLGTGAVDVFPDSSVLNCGQPAKVWRSLTPFVPTRHLKTHRDGRPKLDADGWCLGSPAHDLRRLIREGGLPLPVKVETLHEIALRSRRLRPLDFQTERQHGGGARAHQSPTAFQVTFAEPVQGPLAFGYAAHFGLGLFVPVTD